jgi:uncharacterized protein
MPKESPMTNAKMPSREPASNSPFGLRHFLVIMVSSFVIRILTAVIRIYQLTISPAQAVLFGPNCGCRFTPTCSQYAQEAIRERGALTGSWLAAKRICRCHPFGSCGPDPVPSPKVKGEKVEGGIILEHGR